MCIKYLFSHHLPAISLLFPAARGKSLSSQLSVLTRASAAGVPDCSTCVAPHISPSCDLLAFGHTQNYRCENLCKDMIYWLVGRNTWEYIQAPKAVGSCFEKLGLQSAWAWLYQMGTLLIINVSFFLTPPKMVETYPTCRNISPHV